MTISDSISEELCQAGKGSPVSTMVVKLDKYRIMSDTEVPSEDFLFRMFGKPCFPRRDLSTITGAEKCGKTFFTSMLMACCVKKNVLELERISDTPLKVMWYDTEQSRQSTKSILTERVYELVHTGDGNVSDNDEQCADIESNFYVFNVRACSCQERIDYLIAGIEAYQPDMVIVDNVSDLLPSINDPEKSAQVIDQLMQLASNNNCNITIVIHLNRSGEKRNLRGWLGTEILHKAFDVFYCEQIDNADVFSVEQTFTRKYRIHETLYYIIDDKGLPVVTGRPNFRPDISSEQNKANKTEAYQMKSEKTESFNQKYIIRNGENARHPWEWNLRLLFTDALKNLPSLPLDVLQKEVMELSGIKLPKYYEKVFALAVDQRIVRTTMDKRGRIVAIPLPS